MEGEKKTEDHQEQQLEEEEEMEKMEKLYSLIRHFREARNRLIGLREARPQGEVADEEEPESKKRKKMSEDKRRSSNWVPSFECGDFANKEVEFPGSTCCPSFPALASNSTRANISRNGKNKVEDDDDSERLDLRLSL